MDHGATHVELAEQTGRLAERDPCRPCPHRPMGPSGPRPVPWASLLRFGGVTMGLDVSITISGVREWDPEHRLSENVANWLGIYCRHNNYPDSAAYRDDLDALELSCITRYYGPGYERGPWPDIYAALRALQAIYPDATIRYGSDSADPADVVDAEFLEAMWRHYLGPDGDSYRSHWAGFSTTPPTG